MDNKDNNFLFQIHPSSGVPIYKQVMEQVERLISMGKLKAGDTLPSVRQLASELEVNPMTISKAYMLLEAQGILTRLRGQGMIVSERRAVTLSLEEKIAKLKPVAQQLVTLAHQLDLSPKQVIHTLTSHLKEPDDD